MNKRSERKEKKTKLKFKGRKHSRRGIFSMFLALLSISGFIAAAVMSSNAKGAGGQLLGIMGLLCLLLAVIGFVLAVKSLHEQDIYYFPPVFGAVANGIMLLVLVALYLIGIMM